MGNELGRKFVGRGGKLFFLVYNQLKVIIRQASFKGSDLRKETELQRGRLSIPRTLVY